jgi:hypothetical protein
MPSKSSLSDSTEGHNPEGQGLFPTVTDATRTSATSGINRQIHRYEEELLLLKQKHDEITEEKRVLDEISRKRGEFIEGRREIIEKLTYALTMLERKKVQAEREIEEINVIHDNFASHLAQAEGLDPPNWPSEELATDLVKALACVDQAKGAYAEAAGRLAVIFRSDEGHEENSADDPFHTTAPHQKPFAEMVREGFAYSLPLLVLGIVIFFGFLVLHH